ncbi:phosphoglycerate kinase [Candidatus Saccharibacteria bacterium]|nr:phosphoglycerate kinase [Candidatus Saccharibacteria bacterium]
MFNKKTVREVELTGKRVLLRADFNVPVKKGIISDDYRVKQSLPTIDYILRQKGTSLVIISHLGRPINSDDKSSSLAPVAKHLSSLLGKPVKFAEDCIGEDAKKTADELRAGDILLLENLRYHKEEEKNDEQFAKNIVEASGGEIFVQDGFGVVHRAHASTDAITKLLPAVAGLLLEKEIKAVIKVMKDPARPLLAVVGGAKISDKIEVLNRFIEIADCVAIGGAMTNNFLVAQGISVGKSLIDKESINTAHEILEKIKVQEQQRSFSFLVPVDVVVSTDKDGRATTRVVDIASHSLADIQSYPKSPPAEAYSIAADEMVLDIGPISSAYISGAVKLAKTVIWNGTLGVTETKGISGAHDPFAHGSRMVIDAMIGPTNWHHSKPFTFVGGGDTAAYVEGEGLVDDFNHVSTGGGAALELMSGKSLPGVEVLLNKEG